MSGIADRGRAYIFDTPSDFSGALNAEQMRIQQRMLSAQKELQRRNNIKGGIPEYSGGAYIQDIPSLQAMYGQIESMAGRLVSEGKNLDDIRDPEVVV